MKKLIIILSITTLPFMSFAADSSSGCGLGWQVVKRNSLLSSLTRSFTNALTSNTFGMTSGTSGCASHSIVKKDVEAAQYTVTNFDSLKSEMSIGEGEILAGLGRLMGCSDSSLDSFSISTKAQYQAILPAADTDALEMFYNVKSVINSDPTLTQNCAI